jgi:hypothetical protein
MDDLGSDMMLVTLLDGTLRYEDDRLPRVDIDERSTPDRRARSGAFVSTHEVTKSARTH